MLKASRISSANAYYTPLKKFRAKLESYHVVNREGQFAKEGQVDVVLNLSEIEVIETDAAFPYKATEIKMKFSNEPNSTWVKLEDSIALVCGISVGDASIDILVGSKALFNREDNVLLFVKKDGTESRGSVWTITEVSGVGTRNPFDKAMELIEGKTQAQAKQILVSDPVVKSDPALINAIISGAFFADKRVTGLYKLVNEAYTKKSA